MNRGKVTQHFIGNIGLLSGLCRGWAQTWLSTTRSKTLQKW